MVQTSGRPAARQIFLSYANEDREVARLIADRLTESGIRVSFDQFALTPGDSLVTRIGDALAASDYVLVLLSPNSLKSPWVQFEVGTAVFRELEDRAITVIPILIRDCEVPPLLASKQALDLRSNLNEGIDRLVAHLGAALDLDFDRLDWRQFEQLIAEFLSEQGFTNVTLAGRPGQGQSAVDIIADYSAADPFGVTTTEHWLVQVKFYKHGRADLRSLNEIVAELDRLPSANKALLVTNGQLTSAARDWLTEARRLARIDLRVIDGTELRRLLLAKPALVTRHFQLAPDHE